jgi:hypothetical protein
VLETVHTVHTVHNVNKVTMSHAKMKGLLMTMTRVVAPTLTTRPLGTVEGRYVQLPAWHHEDGVHAVVWCAYCVDWHFHGRGAGHRIEHCVTHPPLRWHTCTHEACTCYKGRGYILCPVGTLTAREVRAVARSMQTWTRRTLAAYEAMAVDVHWQHGFVYPPALGGVGLVAGGKHRTFRRLSTARRWCTALIAENPAHATYLVAYVDHWERQRWRGRREDLAACRVDPATFVARAAVWEAELEARLLAGQWS